MQPRMRETTTLIGTAAPPSTGLGKSERERERKREREKERKSDGKKVENDFFFLY